MENRFDMFRVRDLPISPEGLREYADVMRESCAERSGDMFHLGYQWEDKPHRTVSSMKDRLHAAADEIERLRSCLEKANKNHEHFERECYLRGDEIERLRAALASDEKPVGWLVDEGFMLSDPQDQYAIPLYARPSQEPQQ